MSDVKWIKITTDIFDDEKILLIESLPEADAIIVIWFKLLCLAGKQNNSGVFMLNDTIAYTDKMLATIFRRKESTVQLALKTFEEFGMVKVIDGVITIPNWGKHQNLDQLENRKEYMRDYMREYRKKQAQIADSKDLRKRLQDDLHKFNVNSPEEDIEEDKEKDIEEEGEREEETIPDGISLTAASPNEVVDLFNQICISYPRVKSLSETRKKTIKARLKTYDLDDFKTVFEKAEASGFLKGKNGRDWSATFDWMMKDGNFAKIFDGNYDDKPKNQYGQFIADVEDLYNKGLREWAKGNN